MIALSGRFRRLAALSVVASGTIVMAACSRLSDEGSERASVGGESPMLVGDVLSNDAFRASAPAPEARQATRLPGASQTRDSVVPGMIIRNGSVSVRVDSLELAMAAVRALASRLGGYIGNVSIASGEYQVRNATMELKVPAPRFDDAMTGMSPLGKVEHSSSTAEDVGEEFVDVSARVANSRRLEARLVELLATRAGKLEDVLAVERELARVREDIERHEGRIRYLRTRVATSTISVTVHEKEPLVNPNPGTSVIGESFANMWRNFVHFIAWLIESLGVVIPAALILALATLGWKRWRRPRAPSQSS